ncbi:hypothetical protein DPMN_075048 [Dreissena polymorpha]|uniref:Ig-like domain-containing protein n=1 Tax=Dreissena polymorpha TaxID=45954 RepID=A0A9D4BEK0_DREPO|nr:hypothetical protein DPMN_075048 [Dreissena polymorpha]
MAYDGQSVTLRCHSVSSTVPGDHNLSMTYEWKRGEHVVTSDGKFILEAKSRGSLTIMNVVTSDTKYNFTCRATEDSGNTSLSSDAFYLKVVCTYIVYSEV